MYLLCMHNYCSSFPGIRVISLGFGSGCPFGKWCCARVLLLGNRYLSCRACIVLARETLGIYRSIGGIRLCWPGVGLAWGGYMILELGMPIVRSSAG